MSPYREPSPVKSFVVEAQVRGPLTEFQMRSVVQAHDPGDAIVKFVEAATANGFDLLGEPRIVMAPYANEVSVEECGDTVEVTLEAPRRVLQFSKEHWRALMRVSQTFGD